MPSDTQPVPDAPVAFVLYGTILALAMVLGLRKWSPHRPWLAMMLAIVFGPAGHLYLKGAVPYVLLLYAAWFGLLVATPLPVPVSGLLLTVLSALLMRARIRSAPPAQQGQSLGPPG